MFIAGSTTVIYAERCIDYSMHYVILHIGKGGSGPPGPPPPPPPLNPPLYMDYRCDNSLQMGTNPGIRLIPDVPPKRDGPATPN